MSEGSRQLESLLHVVMKRRKKTRFISSSACIYQTKTAHFLFLRFVNSQPQPKLKASLTHRVLSPSVNWLLF